MNILLQILDDGRVSDAQGRVVSFENTVIVMTTNAGSSKMANTAGFAENQHAAAHDRTMKALSEFLRPEFLNRVDEVITFRTLSEEDFTAIASLMMGDCAAILADKGITLTWTDKALKLIAEKSYSAKFGARNMRRYIQTEVEDRVAGEIVAHHGQVSALHVSVRDGAIAVQAI